MHELPPSDSCGAFLGDEPGLAPARDKRKAKGSPLNGVNRPRQSVQQASDEVDTLCHHDPHTMSIVREIRAWLRDRDNERTKAEDRHYIVPVNRGGGGHILYDPGYANATFTKRTNDH